jgi:predicted RND superfamily exporter protein
MEKEFVVLSLITIVSLCIFLWFTFRNIWGVILPAVVVALGLLFTLALMLATHGGIDLVSIILPTVLFVVGVSDSVHLLNHFYTEIKHGRSNYDAMKSAFQEVGVATFLTAITSAIGFFTLITVTVKPIAFFGIFAAIGIVLVYFITFSFLAAAIYLLPVRLHAKTAEIVPQSFLSRLFEGVLRWRWSLLAILALMVYPMIKGIQAIEVNNFFTEELRPNDPHKKDFDFFGRYFHGVRPFELTVEVSDSQQSLLDSSHLLAMRKLETYLVDSYGVGSLVSPLQPLRLVNQMNQGGAEAAFSLPQNSESEKAVVDSVRMLSEEMNRFILSSNERVGRFSGRVGDLGSAIFLEKNKVFMDFLNREIEPLGVKASLTGISEIIDSNNEYLTDNLMEGLIYELLAIALLMGLLFRNWRITLVSIIPNVFPLLFIGACMGWFGVHLNLSSAIIFNIAFGITVDDTIHLLAGYKLELAKGKRGREALRAAYLHSGKAVFMTSIILCSGFFVLMMSQFNGIYHTGLLVGITLIVALISDLVLLPILLGGKSE